MPLIEGPRIFCESLLSQEEWRETRKKLGGFKVHLSYPEPFECEFKWRWDMGKALTPDKIKLVNTRIDNLRKLLTDVFNE